MVAPKKPLDNHGVIAIRFTHNGFRFGIYKLGEYTNIAALNYAQSICNRIAVDIANNSFSCENNQELILKYHPSAIHTTLNKNIIANIAPKTIDDKLDLKQKCIERLKDSEKVVEKNILSHLVKYPKFIYDTKDVTLFVEWLKKDGELSGVSIARYFDVLKTIDDTFRQITIQKNNKPLPKPFSKKEINDILSWFKNNNEDYYKYVYFLFLTGCRISEAIGMRWSYIDLDNKVIYFYETLARNNNNSSNRVTKTTKKNILRKFPINDKLFNFLTTITKNNNDDLLFLFNDHCIDDKNFCNRYWKKCLAECGIPYRKPSNTRHTFISHFLEKTKDVVKCAALTHGSKSGINTIYKHYAGLINKIEVPDLF